jgi:hypothetical protein
METKQIEVSENTVPGTEISHLPENSKLSEVIKMVNLLVDKSNAKRDRGPQSTKEMTEIDAREVLMGKFANLTHGKAAEALGLSYGQVYSARGGFTFKAVWKEWKSQNPTHGDMAGPRK